MANLKRAKTVFKTTPKPRSFYQAMTAEQRDVCVEQKVQELHRINEWVKQVWNNREDEIMTDDLLLTTSGAYDISYNCDLYCNWLA